MKKPALATSGIHNRARPGTPIPRRDPPGWGRDEPGRRPQSDAGLEGAGVWTRAHRLNVLGLIVEQLAQLHGHRVL